MRQSVLWLLTIDTSDLPDDVPAHEHFARLFKEIADKEPETIFEIVAGVLDTMQLAYKERDA